MEPIRVTFAVLALAITAHAKDALPSWNDGAPKHPKTGRPVTAMVYQPMLELLAYLRANGFKTFIVSGGGNRLMVTPSGLEADNTAIEIDVNGIITRMKVADINADGSPELYVYGLNGTSQTVPAWNSNKNKSLSRIFLPDLDPAQSKAIAAATNSRWLKASSPAGFPFIPTTRPTRNRVEKSARSNTSSTLAKRAGLKVDKVIEF